MKDTAKRASIIADATTAAASAGSKWASFYVKVPPVFSCLVFVRPRLTKKQTKNKKKTCVSR